jgi:hypothetical protein
MRGDAAWPAVVAAVVVMLVSAVTIGSFVGRWFQLLGGNSLVQHAGERWRWHSILYVAGGALLLAIPFWPMRSEPYYRAVVDLPVAIELLLRLGVLTWLIIAAKALFNVNFWNDGCDDRVVPMIPLAIVVAAAIAPPSADLVGLPVRFCLLLFGLIILLQNRRRWAVITGRALAHSIAGKSSGPETVPTRVEQLLAYSAARAGFAKYRRRLVEKLAAGKLTPDEFEQKLAEQRAQLEKLRTTPDGIPIRHAVFARGVWPTSRQNAIYGVVVSLTLAIPWLVIFLADHLGNATDPLTYPMLSFTVNVTGILLTYAAVGFVFGIAYPCLPGQNGLQKAMFLFAVWAFALIPELPFGSTAWQDWRPSAIASLQMFSHLAALGLFGFDLMTVRQSGYDWRALLEAHGMPQLGVSLSSIAAAAGIAASTLVTSHATDLVTSTMKLLLPQVNQTTSSPNATPPAPGGSTSPQGAHE